jgi:hypothetical protein
MSFDSKRLRVQLPCPPDGRGSLVEVELVRTFCPSGSFICYLDTCVFHENSHRPPVCEFDTCGGNLRTFVHCPAGTRVPVCYVGSDPIDPYAVLIDPEQLGALREQLESQLEHVSNAEKQLGERGQGNE